MFSYLRSNTGRTLRRCFAAVAVVCVAAAGPAATQGAGAPNEELLKAAFLFNFAQFTRWPENVPADMPIKFCLFRESMAGDAGASLAGKAIAGRMTAVEAFAGEAPPEDCSVLYVGDAYGAAEACIVARRAAANGTLTVSDSDGFDACGGHIALTTINNRLRFVVNLAAVQQSNLTLSAQLLELAILRGDE